jgi:rhodanese-related sulfurtransferase
VVALKTKNITNAAALLGGFIEWQKENLPIDKKKEITINK